MRQPATWRARRGGGYTYGAQNATCPDGALSKAHAVVTAGANSYCYDRNGNMVRRNIGPNTFNLVYDAENHLTQVNGAATATFGYDGDGQRVVGSEGGTTTVYIGNYFEWHGTPANAVKYYYSGANRVAMRVGATPTVFLMGDHLGSTSVAVDGNGTAMGTQLYKAWGETRAGSLPTKYQYTGQFKDSYIKLYWYGSRWYDPELSRWNQPDSIVPLASQGVQAWDRYAYVNNSPVNYVDPTGHMLDDGCRTEGCDTEREKQNYIENPVIKDLKAEHERKKGTSSQPVSLLRPTLTPYYYMPTPVFPQPTWTPPFRLYPGATPTPQPLDYSAFDCIGCGIIIGFGVVYNGDGSAGGGGIEILILDNGQIGIFTYEGPGTAKSISPLTGEPTMGGAGTLYYGGVTGVKTPADYAGPSKNVSTTVAVGLGNTTGIFSDPSGGTVTGLYSGLSIGGDIGINDMNYNYTLRWSR